MMPVYPGANQLDHYYLEGVEIPRQFFGYHHKAIRALDMGLPQNFECEGLHVDHNGHMALHCGPRGMRPHVIKANVIAVEKLVGLLTSTKSYSLSRSSKQGERPINQAGYLESSRIVNAGAQGVPYERLKFSPSEQVARVATCPLVTGWAADSSSLHEVTSK